MNLLDLFKEGGFIMYPLLIFSIINFWVFFDKWFQLKKFSDEYKRLFEKAFTLVQEKKIDEVRGLYKQASSLISAPYLTLLDGQNQQRSQMEEKISRRLSETQAGLRKYLWILGTIGATAPFVGLFGTVVGIIKAFQRIHSTGKSGFSIVAGDLSEALVATAAGIIVAVVAVMFYNYFQTKIKEVGTEFKNSLEDLADHILK